MYGPISTTIQAIYKAILVDKESVRLFGFYKGVCRVKIGGKTRYLVDQNYRARDIVDVTTRDWYQ